MKGIADFQKAYEARYHICDWIYILLQCLTCFAYYMQEQSKSDAEKLIADMTSLVSNHIRRQKELVCRCLLFVNLQYYFC